MDLGLKNKCVLITGACQGIGLAAAAEFLNEGAQVCITGRNKSKLEETTDYLLSSYPGRDLLAFCCDATKEADIQELQNKIISQWGKVDIIVPNIGCGKPNAENPLDVEEWGRLFEINLFSGLRLITAFEETLKRNKGNIVMLSSIVSQQVFGSSYAYAASKNSVVTLVKYLARDMAKNHVRVNCILPGNVLFEGGRWEEIIREQGNAAIDSINRLVPMQRFGTPKEIAAGIVFLASERASFITGSLLIIDGGQTSVI